MERLLSAVFWGTAAALAFGVLGGLFGAVARAVARRRRGEKGPAAALEGMRSGAAFLGVVGFVAGGIVGAADLSPEERLRTAAVLLVAGAALMLAALGFAALASSLERALSWGGKDAEEKDENGAD